MELMVLVRAPQEVLLLKILLDLKKVGTIPLEKSINYSDLNQNWTWLLSN